MPPGRRAARRTGRRAARRTSRRRAVAPGAAPVSRGRRRRRALVTLLAVGGTAAVAYKIGKKNSQKIEQYTGKSSPPNGQGSTRGQFCCCQEILHYYALWVLRYARSRFA